MSLVRRNVELRAGDGTILAGFWQYGTVSWSTFTTWLVSIVETDLEDPWTIFEFDVARPDHRGKPQSSSSDDIVCPGDYILLRQDGGSLPVRLTEESARRRQRTVSNTPTREDHYIVRSRERDRKCLISGTEGSTWARLRAAHIFPRAHETDWLAKGFHKLITDDAALEAVGGASKIDSIQNVILLRSDLHDLWDNYEFGINPDEGYRITAFTNGLDGVNGLRLQLDHIHDAKFRPLDVLLRDHFLQGILKHLKGAGEPALDYDNTFGDGSFDLSRGDVWGSAEGKERLEVELRNRFFDTFVAQTAK